MPQSYHGIPSGNNPLQIAQSSFRSKLEAEIKWVLSKSKQKLIKPLAGWPVEVDGFSTQRHLSNEWVLLYFRSRGNALTVQPFLLRIPIYISYHI